MKSNIIKYIFIGFVIFIIGFAIYKMNVNENSNEVEAQNEITQTSQKTESTIRIGIPGFDNIIPLITKNQDIISLSTILYEPLLGITQDYGIELKLAEEWSKVEDTVYLVKLKDNLKWENGNAITGTDVKFTVETLQKGESAYSDNVANIKSVEIIEENTIRFNLKKKESFFEYNLIFPILSKEQFEGEDFYKSRLAPISSGMYKVTDATEEQIELGKNENWHLADSISTKMDKIIIQFYNTMGDAYNSLRIGNIDLVSTSKTNV